MSITEAFELSWRSLPAWICSIYTWRRSFARRGVLHKHLPTLWCEDELTNQKVKACPDMDASLVKQANVSRLAALGFVSDETGPSLRATLQSKQGFLLQCDRFFKLELAFWYQSIGDEAADRLHNAIIECFPDGKKILSPWNVKQSLTALSEGKLVKICGVGLAALLGTCIEYVDTLIAGNTVNWKKFGNTPINLRLQTAFGYLCVCKLRTGEVKHGAAALTNNYEQVKKEDGKKEIAYADLRPFRQFAWLLTDGQSVDVKKWFDATVTQKKDERIVVNHHEEAQSKKPRRGGSSSTSCNSVDAVAMVAKLFA